MMRCRNEILCVMFLVGLLVPGAGALASDDECTECHEPVEAVMHFFHESNGVACTDCHGASAEHVDRPRNDPDIMFPKDVSGDAVNGLCLACHDDDSRLHWGTGAHAAADLSCNACHTVHVKRDPILVKATESDVCLDCHVEVRAALKYPSRHPIAEDKTTCGTCHAPHGSSADSMLRGFTLNDTCIGCHKEKRGPVLFEHEPVAEDCSLCHKPHGSILPSLLTARPPFLCQQCHQVASHPSRIPDGTALRTLDSNMLAKGCVNCHSQVHGSNHPSGARLTR